MVEPECLFCIVVESAAHDVPHHEFDSLRAGFAYILLVRDIGQASRVGSQPVEEAFVKGAVNESATLAVNLVRHSPCAENDDAKILGILLDRLADRPAERKTTLSRRRRVR